MTSRCSAITFFAEAMVLLLVPSTAGATCWIPGDHVPLRSWPLLRARSVMRGVMDPSFNLTFP
jgi:hypothetical protein